MSDLQALKAQISAANNGRGIVCAKGIITSFEQGDVAGARIWFITDGDKLRQYPDIKEALGQFLSDDTWGKQDDWLGPYWGPLTE